MAFERVAALYDVWSGEMLGIAVGDARILLVHAGGDLRAYEDRCAHLGVRLSEGRLDGSVLTCGAHHWQYDVRTGAGVNPRSARLRSLPVKIEAGDVWVDLEAPATPTGGRTGDVPVEEQT